MANKKNNQNKKNTDGPTMNGNNTTVTASSIHNASQNSQHSTSPSPNAMHQNNNSAAVTNGTTTPTPSSTTTATGLQHHQSQNQHSHQKPLTTSTSSQQANNSKQPVKKVHHNEVEKILLQINSNVGSQSSHGGVGARGGSGGGGAVKQDPKPKEKEKEKSFQASGRQSNQANHHHHHVHHNTGGGGGCGNQQNHRKKENKNRDQSNQSHRGGGSFGSSHSHQHQSSHSAEIAKSTGFPSNSSLSSSGQTTNSAVQTTPPPVVTLETKIVQTDEIVEKKVKVVIKEEPPHFKSTNPKDMDTVMAFKEHDDWNRVELLLELLSFLSPTDLRLLGNCIEGSVRCYTNQMRPVENTSNSPDPTACLPAFLCSLTPQQPSSFPAATSESSLVNQRSMVNNLFAHQHPPGLPPLIPAMIYPVETNYQQSTSSTAPSSTLPVNTKEICNGTTPTSSTTSASNTPSEPQQQDSQQNVAKTNGSITTSNQPSSKPLPEADALSPTSIRTSSATTPQPEPPVPQEPEKFLRSVRDLTSYLYMLMAVCASTNRKSAAKISDYVKNVVIREKGQILERIPDELDKIDVLQDIGKIVAAMTHHPAVSVDDKMKYADMRDGLRAEIECLFRLYYSPEKVLERKRAEVTSSQGVGDVADGEESEEEDVEEYEIERRYEYTNSRFGNSSQSSSGTFFITRFIGRQVEKSDNLFSIEIQWSDGDRTFAQRTSHQLKSLQHRLLDEFGQQRSEKYHHGMASSISSFDEDHKKLSTSTSTMETSFAPSGERIVPRLARDATPVQYIQYINELSDLPARMMLSTVICEEFNGTRLRTEDETNETSDGLIFSRWKNPRAKSPVRYFQRNAAGKIEAIELPINLQPFIYSNIPQTQMQTLFPSCSNCGGPHLVKDCSKPTLLDKKVEHKMRLDPEGPVTMPPQIPGVTTPAVAYPPMHAQMPHPMYIDNNQMLGVGHFAHHQQQQQQMMQNLYHNGQYRANGQFENPAQLIFYQQVVQNSNNTNANNGNGSGSQNSNF